MTTIGFIGLGRMGAGMAARLIGAGSSLLVHDVAPGAVEALVAKGAVAAGSAKEVGAGADIVLLSLPKPQIVHDALLAEDGVAAGGRARIIVDLSTSGSQMAQRIAKGLEDKGIAAFDAPVSGGVAGARDGKLSLMASGPENAWPEVEPLLQRLGKPFYMGSVPGAGQTMKLINNLLGAVAIAVTAEGVTMGIKAGLDPARMIEVLNQSTGRNSATQDKWPRSVLPRTFDFGFATGLSLKDMRLCASEAEALGAPIPLGSIAVSLLERTAATYGEDSDFTAIAKIVEADAGLDPERPA
ncbi:MAG TPA: NAD(P)-dependent oxidoreductase [Sphingomonadaceae bacterium]|nr:NAD(P)-dependent oxidoreductase [Sphingomonadaceae bacterium]